MWKCLTKFSWLFEYGTVQKRVNLVDLVKSSRWYIFFHVPFFSIPSSYKILTPASIYLKTSASIQPRTGLSKFANNEPKVRRNVGIPCCWRSAAAAAARGERWPPAARATSWTGRWRTRATRRGRAGTTCQPIAMRWYTAMLILVPS